MSERTWLKALAVAAVLAAPAVQAADPPRYRVEVIGSQRTNTQSFALNNAGHVAGTRWFGADEEIGGFIYKDGGVSRLQGLGYLPQVLGLNDRDEIVGVTSDARNKRFAFLYRNGQVGNISASLSPNFGQATAVAINELGHAVGTSGGMAFLYDGQSSRFISHEGFGSSKVTVWGMNDHDAFVGWTYEAEPGEQFAYLWRDGELTRIPGLHGGTGGSAYAVNNADQVVGYGLLPGDVSRPFLYSDGVTRDLGTLGGTPQEGYGGSAYDINDRGWIVGDSVTSTLQDAGFLYMEGRMHNLNELLAPAAAAAWNVTNAMQVNEAGQILAFARRDGNEMGYSVLLSPVPEAQTLALWLAGLALVGATVRARRRQAPA